LGRASAGPEEIGTQAIPEYLMVERAGGGTRGTATAMGRSGV
jgi:hypothetical protein